MSALQAWLRPFISDEETIQRHSCNLSLMNEEGPVSAEIHAFIPQSDRPDSSAPVGGLPEDVDSGWPGQNVDWKRIVFQTGWRRMR
jgi:hypothetical protein